MAKWIALCSLLSAAPIAGFIVGRSTSWDSNNPNTARIFIARHAKWQRMPDHKGQMTEKRHEFWRD
jgi:hypothetical protein